MDYRAKLKPFRTSSSIFGDGSGPMGPLSKRKELVFPYTPTIMVSGNADYEEYNFTHSIYKYNAYTSSSVSEISVTCDFTAQTTTEAAYLLACMHFFRSVTKSYFGASNGALAGAPPPIIKFDYLGDQMFKNVPVIVKNYTYVLEPAVDYVPVPVSNKLSYVPNRVSITVTLDVYYNPRKLRDKFSLAEFRNGTLLQDGYI